MFHCWVWINQFGVWEVFELFISTIASFYLAPFPRIMTSIPHFLYGRLSVFQDTVNTISFNSKSGKTLRLHMDFLVMVNRSCLKLFEIVVSFHPTLIYDHLKSKATCQLALKSCFWKNFGLILKLAILIKRGKYELWAKTVCKAELQKLPVQMSTSWKCLPAESDVDKLWIQPPHNFS